MLSSRPSNEYKIVFTHSPVDKYLCFSVIKKKKMSLWDFPGGPVVRTLWFLHHGPPLDPWLEEQGSHKQQQKKPIRTFLYRPSGAHMQEWDKTAVTYNLLNKTRSFPKDYDQSPLWEAVCIRIPV